MSLSVQKLWLIGRLPLGVAGWCLLLVMGIGATEPQSSIPPGFVERGERLVFDDPFPSHGRRATGLHHAFPEMRGIDDHPLTAAKAELGRLLFFDPILSGDNTLSCATCHHPDFGFADGRPLGMGVGGTGFGPDRKGGRELSRNTPSVWNVGFSDWLFWDGRERDLEEQAAIPLTHADEMAEDPGRLLDELRSVPEYSERFTEAFSLEDSGALRIEHVTEALASFQRTLVSYNSRFDRYTRGDASALSKSEKNGLKLFRSLHTRCFECHAFPTFSDGSFRVLGVADPDEADRGRGGVAERAADFSFKVPTLRNVELTAPYMHDGSLETLEDVITFYTEGGGRREPSPLPGIDLKIQEFELSDQEKGDMVAFLKSLTDTSFQPTAPTSVPSGLPVVPVRSVAEPLVIPATFVAKTVETPARTRGQRIRPRIQLPPGSERPLEIIRTREMVRAPDADSNGEPVRRLPAATFHVRPGHSIQAALDRARAGDRIELGAGVYFEELIVEIEDLTLAGTLRPGFRSIIDGQGERRTGLTIRAPGLTLEHLTLRNHLESGFQVERTEFPNLEDLLIEPIESAGYLQAVESDGARAEAGEPLQ